MAASTKVKFLTGLDTSLDSTPIVKGQILFSIDAQNFGQIWYDKSNSVRVRMTGAADWGKILNIPQIVEGALATNTASTGITIQLYDLNGTAIPTDTSAINGVITIPAANGNGTNNVAGLVTTSAQTFTGIKTFNSAIKSKNDNDFISHSNEFNFAPALTDNMEIHINHRTAGTNTSGKKITKYHFKDGNGAYSVVKADSFDGTVDWSNLDNVPQAVEGALGSQVSGQNSGNGYKIQLYDLGGNPITSSNAATNGVILIPYASGDTIGLVSATAQTWKGNKTFSNDISVSGNGSITGTLGVTGVATFNNTTDASATSIASVVIKGGLGVAKKMFIGDDILAVGTQHRIGRYVDSTHTYTWVYDDYNSGVGGLWIGSASNTDVHAGLLTLHAGLANTTNGYVNQSIKVVIGASATDNTGATRNLVYTDASANGGTEQPIYVDSNGKITQTTYALSATIDAGTANRMAYYSAERKIEDAGSIYASADSLTINDTSAPANSGKFQVKGISTMQTIYPESTRTYGLGSDSLGWAQLYIDNNNAANLIIFKCEGTQYGRFNIESKGTTSVEGASILYLGNDIANDANGAGNASGQLRLYSDGATFCTYRSNSWSGWGTQEFYTFLGKRSTTANDNAYTTLILGNNANVNSTASHTEGRLRIFSAATCYHEINGLSTTMHHIHVLPNPNQPGNNDSPNNVVFDSSNNKSTSWIAIGGNGTNLGVADETQLMYLNTSGTLTASTTSVGGFSSGTASHKPVYLDAGVITEYDYELSATVRAADEILTGEQWGVAYYKSVDEIVATPAGDDHQILQAHTNDAPDWVDAFTDLSWSGQTTASVDINATVAGVSLSATIPVADGTANDTKSGIITNTTQSIAGNKTFMADTYVRNNLYVGTLNSALGSVYFYTSNNYTTRLTMNSTTNVTGNRAIYIPNYNSDMYLVHTAGTAAVGSTQQPIYIAADGRATAITAANLASFVDGQHKWVRIDGDTMTGNLTINHSYTRVNFYDGTRTVMWAGKSNATAAYMGLYSLGYYTTDGTWTDDAKYIAYRAPGGDIYLNGHADTATTSTWTTLIKPIASTTTASASTWNIPSGSKQVWGERFSDSTLKYTPEGGSATTITDTGDWVMWLTPNATSNAATLNMRIDGTYYGSFSGNVSGNASTATKWATARTLTIGGTGKSVDGSGNVSWSKAEILGSSTNANFYRGDQTWSNTLNGTFTANGYLKSTLNGNTIQIGSQNTSFCHISNSAAIPFWFNQDITMAQGKHIGQAGSQYCPFQLYLGRYTTSGSNALNANSPLIEFSNSDRSQYCQLIYDDWDSLQAPDSLTLVGNQNGITFICKNGPIWIQGGSNAGGNINRLTTSNGMPGNMQYNTSRRGTQIYSNGIAFCDPYNGNSNSDAGWIRHVETTGNSGYLEIATGDDASEQIYVRQYNTSNAVARSITLMDGSGYSTFIRAYNAVWNDVAEYRKSQIKESGYVIVPSGDLASDRLMAGARIISDTYGFALGGIGPEEQEQMPIAIAGRVLAYPYQDKSKYKVGDAVCSAPGGMVDIMTRDEIKEYPDRIIGIVNEIPDYDIWEPSREGEREPVHTNGRIWIDIK